MTDYDHTRAYVATEAARKPSGLMDMILARLDADTTTHLPGHVVVRPTQLATAVLAPQVPYGIVTRYPEHTTGAYVTHRGSDRSQHDSLAAAVAYLIQRHGEADR